VIRIDVLPDDVLLEIFDFYVSVKEQPLYDTKADVEAWHSLVHVCRRWRRVAFGSPHRLNLKLYCTPKTPSRDILDVWPALPLIIEGDLAHSSGADDIIVALGQTNRVREVKLCGAGQLQLLEKVLAAMQVPFLELTVLQLQLNNEMPSIPDSFLGGSAAHLRHLELWGIQFPGLQKLLLSATHLVKLYLWYIPHSGYISPEAMVTVLSVLSHLEMLSVGFESPQSHPDLES
jgi:F-box associated protein